MAGIRQVAPTGRIARMIQMGATDRSHTRKELNIGLRRLLLAQAFTEPLQLITADKALAAYGGGVQLL